MYEIVVVLLLIVAIAIVALILVQQGKGAGMGASFGAGASNTVFGAAGSGNFLTKSTWTLAIVFFAICLLIGWLQKDRAVETGSFENITPLTQSTNAADVPVIDSEAPIVDDSTEAPAVTNEAVTSDAPVVTESNTTEVPAVTEDNDAKAPAVTEPNTTEAPAITENSNSTEAPAVTQ